MLAGSAAVAAVGPFAGKAALAAEPFAPKPGAWRTFETTTRIEIAKPDGATRVWMPAPSLNAAGWNEPGDTTWTGNFASAALDRDAKYGAAFVRAEWAATEKAPVLEVVSRVRTRDRAVDMAAAMSVASLSEAERSLYTAATDLMPLDGIVKTTADGIVKGVTGDVARGRGRCTNGSSRTRSARQPRAAAASATSPRC